MEYYIEERKEVCSVASKLVSLKIYRLPSLDQKGEGEIVDFHCNQSSTSCESRCTYKLLLNDF
jgi:hypothetical protein